MFVEFGDGDGCGYGNGWCFGYSEGARGGNGYNSGDGGKQS